MICVSRYLLILYVFFFFKQKTAYEMLRSLVGSEMCIRDRINTLEYIRRLTNGRPIQALLGGMHLAAASHERMENTLAAFRRLGIRFLGPSHCTGFPAQAQLWNAFPGHCATCAVGTTMRFLR